MISKILESTKGRPCSCPEGKKCTACTEKRLKPRYYVETSKSPPPVPVVISHFRRNSNTIRIKDSLSRLKPLNKEARCRANICQWYKRRRARSELKKDHKRQQELYERARINKAYREREKELLEQFREQQKFIDSLSSPRSSPGLEISRIEPKPQKKRKEPKVRSTNTKVKPTNYVIREKHKDPLGVRCANWWYRACCKFFCCLSCILIIGFAILFVIPTST